MLCTQISTKNYRKKKSDKRIRIEIEDSLNKNVKFIPIFPIKKNICYLYNLKEHKLHIEEFKNLKIIPAFPKSILTFNGDLHIVGGANEQE